MREFNKYLILTFALFCMLNLPVFGEDNIRLKWKEIEGAKKYRLQIRDSNQNLVINLDVFRNEFNAELRAGSYEIRIGVANKFGKYDTWSEWKNLTVQVSRAPVIKNVIPLTVYKDTGSTNIDIDGENFYNITKFYLKKNNSLVPVKKVNIHSPDKATISLGESVDPGNYRLILRNPGDKNSNENFVINIQDRNKDRFVLRKNMTVNLIPQYLIFLNQKNNAILKSRFGINAEVYFNSYSFYNFFPGINIGYISLKKTNDPQLALTGYRIDALLAYRYQIHYRIAMKAHVGIGTTGLFMDAQFRNAETESTKFQELNLFGGLSFYYAINKMISLSVGADLLRLMDQYGSVDMINPRLSVLFQFW